MNNSRKESRKKLMAFTPVYELQHKTILGYIGDLTLKGAMIIGEKTLEVNRHLTLGIEFPEAAPGMKNTRVVVAARVAWCRDDETPQNYNIGFEFTDISPENLKVIEAILERFQFRSVMNVSDLQS